MERPTAASSSRGEKIGRYEVRRTVGHGGMGVVLAAYDPELDRQVAIKLVAAERAESRARLVREAQALARLSDPNVVMVYEVIWIGDRAGIVMELVDGQDLAAWRTDGAHPWREIVGVYAQAARGLAAAHRAGLVHRDFKPSNAVIGKDGVVRVTDFGLVCAVATEGADSSSLGAASPLEVSLTRTGAVFGTPGYMAPEQHLGKTVDARTDQWALGCSLYEALHGFRPFEGKSFDDLRDSVVAGQILPEPTSTRVPASVRAAVRRALSPNPADRFANMDELVAALEAPGRRVWQSVAAVGAVLLVSAAATMMLRHSAGAPSCAGLDAPLVQRWNPEKARTLRAKLIETGGAATVVDRIVSALNEYGGRWTAARSQACTQAGDKLDRRMRCLDQRLVEFGAVVDGIAGAPNIGGATEAVDRLRLISDCDDPRDTLPRPSDAKARLEIDRAENDLARGWATYELNQYERAQSLAQEAAAVGAKTGWAPLEARALVLVGNCQDRQRKYPDALATLERAAELGAVAKDDAVVAEALARRFFVLDEHLGRFNDAVAGRNFIELALVRAGQPPRLRAEWLHYLAVALLELDRYDDALAAENEALEMWRELVRPDNARRIDSLETKANIQIKRQQFADAQALLDEVLKARVAARGPDDPTVAEAEGNIASLEFHRNEIEASIEHWTQAARINRATGTLNWRILVNLANAHAEIGHLRAAAATFAEARQTAEREAPGKSLWLGECDTGLGSVLFGLGQIDRARPLIDSGVATARASKAPFVVIALFWSVKAALLRGDVAKAAADLDELVKADDDPKDPQRFILEADLARARSGCRGARKEIERALVSVKDDPWRSERLDAAVLAAECDLELGEPKRAIAELEPELSWLEAHRPDAEAAAAARFAIARALVATGGDRARARSLATQAREGLFGKARAAATRWLSQNAGP